MLRHPGSLGRVDPRAFLDELTADTDIASSLVHVQHLPARAPAIEPFPDGLPDLLVSRLGLTGVRGLYPHQADGLAVPVAITRSRPSRRTASPSA